MRSSRAVALTLVIAISLLSAPEMFAKVCHPRKPVTCSSSDLSKPAVPATTPATAPKVETKAVKVAPAKAPQQAMVCGPWVKFRCITTTNPLIG
jgi:hypothetical protein